MTENRSADWMPSTIIEREASLRQQSIARHDRLALTLGAVACIIGPLAFTWLIGSLLGAGAGALLGIPIFLIAIWIATRIDRRRENLVAESAIADRALLDEFGSGRGWFVDITILRGAAPTGVDRGMLWFEDGQLIFSGHRTSFALRPGDVPPFYFPKLQQKIVLPLQTTAPGLPASLSISIRRSSRFLSGSLIHDLENWKRAPYPPAARSNTPIPVGQLPPLTVGPGAPTLSQLFLRGFVTTLGYFAVVLILFPFISFLSLIVLFLAIARDPWRPHRDRRNLKE